MKLEIEITDNPDFASFAPISGSYYLGKLSSEMEEITPQDIEDAIAAELTAKHGAPFRAEIFRANGHAITGETPAAGAFVVTRK